jgi:hypothetical protein
MTAPPCDNHRTCRNDAEGGFYSPYHEADLWLCSECRRGFRRDFGEENVQARRGRRG